MMWFGESWGARICNIAPQVPVPSAPCYLCGKTFNESDVGLVLRGPGLQEEHPVHLRCHAANVGLLTVHVLRYGQPICRFSTTVPGEWPNGHVWSSDWKDATCPVCRDWGEAVARGEAEDWRSDA